ncbi:MAG: hypothetical protein FWC92_03100 [Defluviitaleaceae bacterium]|nr:hypothetical protein [Defluviitaleaceae bacterium]
MSGKLIESAIKEKLTDEKQKNVLRFIASMQENGFTFNYWSDGDCEGWDPTYNGKGIGCALVHDNFMFFIGLTWGSGRNDIEADDELREFAWSSTTICPQRPCKPPYCQGENHSKNRWQIFGKQYESTCHSPLQFIDPDAQTLDNILKLLVATK